MSGAIAVINAGSWCIKFALYEDVDSLLFRGQVEQIGVSPSLRVVDAGGERPVERNWPAAGFDHRAATRVLGLELDKERNGRGSGRISSDTSRVSVWVVPTDEEDMVARHTAAVLGFQ